MNIAILPKRLLDIAKKYKPDLVYPDFTKDRLFNSKQVKAADQLTMFVDADFYKIGKSIGTKVELMNNRNKINAIYELQPDGSFKIIDSINLTETLPTWDDYIVKGDDALKKDDIAILKSDDTKLDVGTCKSFVHNPTPEADHIHVCSNELNKIKRCGFNSVQDSKSNCPFYEAGK